MRYNVDMNDAIERLKAAWQSRGTRESVELPLPISHHNKGGHKNAWKIEAQIALVALRRPDAATFELVLDCYGPWWKNGNLDKQMPDAKNMLWDTEDFIAECLKFDDTQNHRVIVNKHESKRAYCVVTLRPCPPLVPGR
jgi:hypothetical protein